MLVRGVVGWRLRALTGESCSGGHADQPVDDRREAETSGDTDDRYDRDDHVGIDLGGCSVERAREP